MADTPKWFDETYYMNAKLAQMQESDPDYTMDDLKAAFEEAKLTPYEHYDTYGDGEGLSPNPYFDRDFYMASKLDQMQESDPDYTMEQLEAAFKEAGLTAYEHYNAYGADEGLNPSKSFDNAKYMQDKLEQMQESDPDYTMEQLEAAFAAAGLSPLEHYLAYGEDEGLSPSPVTKDWALTTGIDKIEGADDDDVVSGVASSLSSDRTLNVEDTIDGGAGDDTLQVDMQSNFTGFTTGFMKNVENVELINEGTIARTFSAKGITGAENYALTGDINLTDLAAAGITVELNGQQREVSLGFTADAVKGAADELTLNVDGLGAAKTDTAAQKDVKVTAGGIEKVIVDATGDNFVNLSDAATKSVVVTGDGNLTVAAVTGITSFDASAMTGDVTADLTGAGTLTAVTGGAGDDTLTVNKIAPNATLEGGAGNDTLVLKEMSGTIQPTMSGFENIKVDGGTLTLSGKDVQDFTALEITGGAKVTLANVDTPAFTVTASGATDGSVTLSSPTNLTYNTAASDATAKAKGSDAVSATLTATEATSATINVGAYTSQTGDITLSKAADVTVNVASALGADGKTEQTSFSATLDAAKAGSLVVKADGNLGGTFNVNEAASVSITAAKGSSGVDVNAAKATMVDITAGAAMNIAGSDFSGAESVTLTQNKGALTGANVNFDKINTLTVAGADATSAVTVGALGKAQDYGITVNASGLKGGFTFGAVTTLGDVALNLADVTGAVDGGAVGGNNVTVDAAILGTTKLGDITAAGNVTVDALGILGGDMANAALTLGDISADQGDITVQFDGGSDVTIGALTGKTVTLDASNYLGVINGTPAPAVADATIGAINAASATIKGSEIGANTFASITADNLTYTGGLDADTVTLTGKTATGDVTMALSMDTGAGVDVVTITAASTTGKTMMTGTIANAEKVTIEADDSAPAAILDMSGLTITGNTAADTTITGGQGADILKAAVNGGTITGGAGADQITLGAGVDTVVYATFTDSVLATYDVVTGFTIGTDSIKGTTAVAAGSVKVNGDVAALTESAIQTVLTDQVLTANGAATFTFEDRTFLVLDDGTAGYAAATDALIEITGYNGNLDDLSIIIA